MHNPQYMVLWSAIQEYALACGAELKASVDDHALEALLHGHGITQEARLGVRGSMPDNLLKQLGSVFYKFDDEGAKRQSVAAPPAPVEVASQDPATVGVTPHEPTTSVMSAEERAKIAESARGTILKALKAAAHMTMEFEQSLAVLAATIPDEKQRYQTAVNLLSHKGNNAAAMVAEFTTLIDVVNKTQRDFIVHADAALSQKLEVTKQEREDGKRKLADLRDSVVSLSATIAKMEATQRVLDAGVVQDKAFAQEFAGQIVAICGTFVNDLETRKQRMITYAALEPKS